MIDLRNKKYEIILRDYCVYIKYYKRIIDINSNLVKIAFNSKILLIKGSNLMACALDEYEIVIKGNILSIEFINE